MAEGVLKKEQDKSWISVSFRLLPVFFALILFAFFLFYDQSAHKFDENEAVAQTLVGLTVILSSVAGFILYKKDLLKTKTVVILLAVCGFALRLAYALKFGYNVHQHDVESLDSSGHLSYIYSLANGNGLPDTNDWQFSHPPLHHFLSALSVKLSYLLGFTNGRAFENIQYLTVFYSTLTMFAGYRILKLCNLKGSNLLISMALLVFHPTFQILAGSINNDVLTILLSMYGIVYLMKWYREPSVKYAALCGLFIGLGMMTKVSAALMAVVAAVTVLIKFIVDKELKFSRMVLHALIFVIILLPLGMWHPVRNYLLFDQPLGYVAPIPTTSSLYIGDVSVFDRIILPFSKDRFGVYVDVWEEYNLWYYTLRNSLFGEYNFGNFGFAGLLVLSNLILILFSLFAVIYFAVKRFKQSRNLLPIFVLFIIQLGFFIYFNLKYPFGCTMDFRYIVPLLFCGVTMFGVLCKTFDSYSSVAVKSIVSGVKFTAIAFCILSVFVMF